MAFITFKNGELGMVYTCLPALWGIYIAYPSRKHVYGDFFGGEGMGYLDGVFGLILDVNWNNSQDKGWKWLFLRQIMGGYWERGKNVDEMEYSGMHNQQYEWWVFSRSKCNSRFIDHEIFGKVMVTHEIYGHLLYIHTHLGDSQW